MISLFKPLHAVRRVSRVVGAPPANSNDRREGDGYRDSGRWTEAARSYQRHLEDHPDDYAIWVQLGNCLKEANSFEAALAAYRRAIILDGAGDSDIFLQLGHLQKLMGRPDEAVEAYRASIARQPHNNPAADELATLGVVAEVRQLAAGVQPGEVDRALRTIDDQLRRLIDAVTTAGAQPVGGAASAELPARSPAMTLVPAPAPVGAKRRAVFLLADPIGPPGAETERFVCSLGQALAADPIFFVQWGDGSGRLQLLPNAKLGSLGLSGLQGRHSASDSTGEEPRVVLEPSSCGGDDWLLVPTTLGEALDQSELPEMNIILEARRLGLRTAFIFHGADALRLRKHAGRAADACERYMQSLLLADVVVAASSLAMSDLSGFFSQHQQATAMPLIKRIAVPRQVAGGGSADEWSTYARRIRGLLTDAADPSRTIASLYYWIDPALPAATPGAEFSGELAATLARRGIELIPVLWNADSRRVVAATPGDLVPRTRGGGTIRWAEWVSPGEERAPNWLLVPCGGAGDLASAAGWAGSQGVRTAAVLHEAADRDGLLVAAGGPQSERALFEALAGIDKVFAVTDARLEEFFRFLRSWRGKVHSAEHRFETLLSPNEVVGGARRLTPKRSSPGTVCVLIAAAADDSNYLQTVLAAAAEAARRSTNRLVFTLSGNASDLPEQRPEFLTVKAGGLEGGGGDALFADIDFIVYAGLAGALTAPVLEGLWRGLPCLAHGGSEIGANAPRPGIVVADMTNSDAVAEAILSLAEPEWRRCVANEAIARPLRPWDDYAREITVALATDRLADGLHRAPLPVRGNVYTRLVNLRPRPRLSVCISTYNRAGWLEVNLQSIFLQLPTPREDLEIVVVDNASTDHTPAVVEPYLPRPDFRYLRNPKNVGMLGNLAITAQRSRGEYVWIVGDDDLVRFGVLKRVLDTLRRHPGIALIYLNYGYTSESDPAKVTDLASFLDSYNTLEPAGPDEVAPVNRLAAKSENFYTAIYSHVYRRDHAMRSYCQNTSGRIFSTMLSCIPTAYYVLNYMPDEPAYWMGEPALVVNSNVSWQDYGALLDLEQLPRAWDLAERMGADPGEVDRRRANRLWLVKLMWQQIFESDRAGNSAYFSAPRVLLRLKHLTEIEEHIDEFRSIYERAREAGHPAARMRTDELFSAFTAPPDSAIAAQ